MPVSSYMRGILAMILPAVVLLSTSHSVLAAETRGEMFLLPNRLAMPSIDPLPSYFR